MRGIWSVGFKAVGQGNTHAVELVQHAHGSVIKRAGGLLRNERVQLDRPLPRGAFLEMLIIDDHIGIQLVPTVGLSRVLNRYLVDLLPPGGDGTSGRGRGWGGA